MPAPGPPCLEAATWTFTAAPGDGSRPPPPTHQPLARRAGGAERGIWCAPRSVSGTGRRSRCRNPWPPSKGGTAVGPPRRTHRLRSALPPHRRTLGAAAEAGPLYARCAPPGRNTVTSALDAARSRRDPYLAASARPCRPALRPTGDDQLASPPPRAYGPQVHHPVVHDEISGVHDQLVDADPFRPGEHHLNASDRARDHTNLPDRHVGSVGRPAHRQQHGRAHGHRPRGPHQSLGRAPREHRPLRLRRQQGPGAQP